MFPILELLNLVFGFKILNLRSEGVQELRHGYCYLLLLVESGADCASLLEFFNEHVEGMRLELWRGHFTSESRS